MKKIIFFNTYHIGDVFLPMSYIENIVKSNQDVEFYYWCVEGHSFFKNINIKFITNFTAEDFFSFNKNVITIKDNFIFINTWIGSFWADNDFKDLPVGECEILKKYPIFERICTKLNLNFTLKKEDIFFKMPFVDIASTLTWFELNKNFKKIFYFNYLARSGQIQPINSLHEHEIVINTLADKHNNHIVLVPDNITPTKKNIINCEHVFNIKRSPTSEHLIQLHNIANLCDYAVYVDTGGCFLFANKNSIASFSKKILLTTGSSARYGQFLNNASNYVYNKNCIQQIHCNNMHDAITELTNIIQ